MGAESSKPVNLQEKKSLQQQDQEQQALENPVLRLSETMANVLKLDDDAIKKHYGPLTSESLAKYAKEFDEDDKNLLALNAVMGNDPTQVMVNRRHALKDEHVFNVKLELEGAVTNQKSSGRCWIFAGTNVLRRAVIEKYKLSDDFELSQSYLFFYGKMLHVWFMQFLSWDGEFGATDKLEKANWFLENMIDLADKDVNDRVVQYLLTSPVQDGGQVSIAWQ